MTLPSSERHGAKFLLPFPTTIVSPSRLALISLDSQGHYTSRPVDQTTHLSSLPPCHPLYAFKPRDLHAGRRLSTSASSEPSQTSLQAEISGQYEKPQNGQGPTVTGCSLRPTLSMLEVIYRETVCHTRLSLADPCCLFDSSCQNLHSICRICRSLLPHLPHLCDSALWIYINSAQPYATDPFPRIL